ncbi:hypothetical protein VTO42DRAFT_476 [Malbranchea cinnamomea]
MCPQYLRYSALCLDLLFSHQLLSTYNECVSLGTYQSVLTYPPLKQLLQFFRWVMYFGRLCCFPLTLLSSRDRRLL